MRTVVVTGVSGYWGRRVARQLLAEPNLRVLGIDARPPQQTERGLDFIKADIRNPLLSDLLRVEGVDTVVHLAWRERQWRPEEDFGWGIEVGGEVGEEGCIHGKDMVIA